MEKGKKAIVILSGGMDSVTTLYWAKENYEEVEALSFNYGSKHSENELRSARLICELNNIPQKVIKLDFVNEMFKSNLLQSGGDIPEGHYEDENMKLTVVPFRNGIMLSCAVGYAESVNAEAVLTGVHFGDHEIYLDCREEFIQTIGKAAELGTYNKIKIIAPFNTKTKSDIVKWGLEKNVPFETCWSCYSPKNGRPCLKCGTCFERTESFLDNNVKDPLLTEEEWEEAIEYLQNQKGGKSK